MAVRCITGTTGHTATAAGSVRLGYYSKTGFSEMRYLA